MESCGGSLIKYLLFFTNFVIFLLGVIVLGFSAFAYADGDLLQTLLKYAEVDWTVHIYGSTAVLFMIAASIVILISFLGCCGAIKENKCFLGLFIMIMIALFGVIVAGVVLGTTQDIKKNLEEPLLETLSMYDEFSNNETQSEVTKSWMQIMTDFSCCGVNSYSDWQQNNSNYGPGKDEHVPKICCKNIKDLHEPAEVEDCMKNPGDYAEHEEMEGCITKLYDSIKNHEDYIVWTAVAVLVVMGINLFLATATYFGIRS